MEFSPYRKCGTATSGALGVDFQYAARAGNCTGSESAALTVPVPNAPSPYWPGADRGCSVRKPHGRNHLFEDRIEFAEASGRRAQDCVPQPSVPCLSVDITDL